jgi:ADP-dependent phosphofructokinase/glucokinase
MLTAILTGKDDTECIEVHTLGFLVAIFKLGESITHERLPSCPILLRKRTGIGLSNERTQ